MAEPGDELIKGLTRALARAGLDPPAQMNRLAGGANMDSWLFTSGAQRLVLRRAPSAAFMAGRQFDHAGEAALIRIAHRAGVSAPEVVAELAPADGIGTGFIMRAIAGSADPSTILAGRDPTPLLADLARELALIHQTDVAALPQLPVIEPGAAVAALRERFLGYGGDRPIQALALRWLEHNLPQPIEARLVHGDYRLGNILVEHDRLTGVLDWELAHLGDPHEDIAFGCMTVWRFGRPDRPAFGLGTIDQFAQAYRAAGGEALDPARFQFWLIYRTLWWALGCLEMGSIWRSGADRSLERVVISRRCAEQELDLLCLLEADAPEAERSRALPPASALDRASAGEATASEILTAISEWLASEIKPLVSGRARFDLAVARNALGIVAREQTRGPDATDRMLADQILAGEIDLAAPGLLARLRRVALDKITADMPKYPVLASIRQRWEGQGSAASA